VRGRLSAARQPHNLKARGAGEGLGAPLPNQATAPCSNRAPQPNLRRQFKGLWRSHVQAQEWFAPALHQAGDRGDESALGRAADIVADRRHGRSWTQSCHNSSGTLWRIGRCQSLPLPPAYQPHVAAFGVPSPSPALAVNNLLGKRASLRTVKTTSKRRGSGTLSFDHSAFRIDPIHSSLPKPSALRSTSLPRTATSWPTKKASWSIACAA
jgi:hypothetical protein